MVIAEPKPKPPVTCTSCGEIVTSVEEMLGDDVCPKHRFWGHIVDVRAVAQLPLTKQEAPDA